jgi:hypothetical protein
MKPQTRKALNRLKHLRRLAQRRLHKGTISLSTYLAVITALRGTTTVIRFVHS